MTNNAGNGIQAETGKWEFNATVAQQFDLHVQQSVPFYLETQKIAVELSDWYIRDGATVLDIGCATGATIADLVRRHSAHQVSYIGIDNSKPMIDQAGDRLKGFSRVRLIHGDVMKTELPAELSMIYGLYTVQFLDPQRRQELFSRAYQLLKTRGAFILVEKVLDSDPMLTEVFINLHWAKKEELGFDVSEIYGKAQALRGVLVPLTLDENIELLQRAGFSRIGVFFKWCNFAGIIAIK